MGGFIKDYLNNLRHSDENTKHRSALTISIIGSVIILSILFLLFKNVLFFRQEPIEGNQDNKESLSEKEPDSPLVSFSSFFRETSKRFSNIKSIFGEISEIVEKGEEINLEATSTKNTPQTTEILDKESVFQE